MWELRVHERRVAANAADLRFRWMRRLLQMYKLALELNLACWDVVGI
jgi:hypothetical protein